MQEKTLVLLAFLTCLVPLSETTVAQQQAAIRRSSAGARKQPATAPSPVWHDLTRPEFTPPEAPEWLKEDLPEWVRPLVGKNGLLHPWRDVPGPMGKSVKGLDRYQANHFIFYRPATAKYLYDEYTPLKVDYKKGALPTYEKVVGRYTAGCESETQQAVALLTQALPELCKHPTVPPRGGNCRADRDLDDEALLKSGSGWCNEQARVFVRMCQVCGIPARIVHLFYSDNRSGHTLAEFHADGRWAMADVSWFCVFPDKDGKLLSAAQCHDRGHGQESAGIAYVKRFRQIAQLSDEQLHVKDPKDAERLRKELLSTTPQQAASKLSSFGIINYPLPG